MSDFFLKVIESLPHYVFYKDSNLVYQFCNKNFAESVGFTSCSEVKGKSDYDVSWLHSDAEVYRREDLEIIHSGKPIVNSIVKMHFPSEERVLLVNKSPFFRDAHATEVVGILCICMDITDQVKLQEKLIETQVNEQTKAMSAIGGMIAHELRTPLLGIKSTSQHIHAYLPRLLQGYEYAVKAGGVSDPIRADQLELLKGALVDIDHAVGYAQNTVKSILLGFEHTRAGEALPDMKLFDLGLLVDRALECYPMQPAQRAKITVQAMDHCMVWGQEEIVMSVLHNLLKNALQSIDAGGRGTIVIDSVQEGDKRVLRFKDTAKGIPPEHLPHIFEPFYTTKKKASQSVGLGLYFCKMALQRMGADIACESECGAYALFMINLRTAEGS